MVKETDDGGFLSRWSRRKLLVRQGEAPVEPMPSVDTPPQTPNLAAAQAAAPGGARPTIPATPPASATPETPPPPPAPTLADVAALSRDSDYTRFVAPGVDTGVKNAALKKLFTDPHFNVMDGLDTYIDDYGIPDPLPAGMLRQMAQSQFLGLFTDETTAPDSGAEATANGPGAAPDLLPPAQTPSDEDAALRLQPHHAAGPTSAGEGADPDPGRKC